MLLCENLTFSNIKNHPRACFAFACGVAHKKRFVFLKVGSWGQPGNRYVSFASCVRACARSGCLVAFDLKSGRLPIRFSLLLFELSFSLPPHTPNLLSNLSWTNQYELEIM